METAVIHFIILGVISGLTEGAGVLPDGPLNATVGETVMFNTTLTPPENPFVAVDWKFGDRHAFNSSGMNLTGPEYDGRVALFMSTGSLELRNVALNDSGEYSVSILPHTGSILNGSTRLEVYEPVSYVMATASSMNLVEFSSVRLSCSSSGSSLSYIWMNGSSEVTASDRVQLTGGGSTLTIVSVSRYDQGLFRCHVFNPVSNSTSAPVNLSISYGPENIKLTVSPPQQYHAEGSDVILSCSADSRHFTWLDWFMNGKWMFHTGPELRLTNIQMHQSGNYSCEAFNLNTWRLGMSQPSVVTVVERISAASITPSTNLVIEGNFVNLTCDADGSIVTRKWTKDGSDLIPDENVKLHDESKVLAFHPLRRTDRGEYSCKISNPVSSVETKYHMVINYGPENVQITGPSQIHVGQPFTLTCSADSTLSASYTWRLNGTEIHNSPTFTKHFSEFSDSGIYTCEAMDKITGRTSSKAHELSVTDKTSGFPVRWIWTAGTILTCLVVCGSAAGGGYCIYRKKVNNKAPSDFGDGVEKNAYEIASIVYENPSSVSYENPSVSYEN